MEIRKTFIGDKSILTADHRLEIVGETAGILHKPFVDSFEMAALVFEVRIAFGDTALNAFSKRLTFGSALPKEALYALFTGSWFSRNVD